MFNILSESDRDMIRRMADKEREPMAAVIAESIRIDPPKVDRLVCHGCGVHEGQFHRHGCDVERCPFCGRQLIACMCCYKLLNIDYSEGTWAYSNGLTAAQQEQWDKMLREKGLVPYISYPNICCRCGKLWPSLFMVPTSDWKRYVPKEHWNEILCLNCYKAIKFMIDTYAKSDIGA